MKMTVTMTMAVKMTMTMTMASLFHTRLSLQACCKLDPVPLYSCSFLRLNSDCHWLLSVYVALNKFKCVSPNPAQYTIRLLLPARDT